MKILNELGEIITDPDLKHGYLSYNKILKKHHEFEPGRPAVTHSEVINRFSNGGIETRQVIDEPAVPPKDAYDEYDEHYVYHEYPPEAVIPEASMSWEKVADSIRKGVNEV